MDIEKLKRDYFSKYVTWKVIYGDIVRLLWHDPGTIANYIVYLLDSGTLCVYGDLDEAIYRWKKPRTLEQIACCDIETFTQKCMASDNGLGGKKWSLDAALAAIEKICAKKRGKGCLEPYQAFIDLDGPGHLSSNHEWCNWLESEEGEEFFGDDCSEYTNIGEVFSLRCHLHLLGLKMAFDKEW